MAAKLSKLHPFVASLFLALPYFATGRLGLLLPAFGTKVALIWLPAGLSVAALLRFGLGCWPGITLGAFAVSFSIGNPWPIAFGVAVGNTLGMLGIAWALQRLDFHPAFDRARDILLLVAVSAVGMVVSAGVGVGTLTCGGRMPVAVAPQAWMTWWVGDMLGVIGVVPLLLTFTVAEVRKIMTGRAEFVIWLAAMLATIWGVFIVNGSTPGHALALAFVPLPLVAWAALRFGAVGTSLGLFLLYFGAAYGTGDARGPFSQPEAMKQVAVLWIYMGISAVLGWLISTLHCERKQAVAQLESSLSTLQLFINTVPAYISLVDTEERYRLVNRSYEEYFGLPAARLVGQRLSDVQPAAAYAEIQPHVRAALSGETVRYRAELPSPDGQTRWFDIQYVPRRDEAGAVAGFFVLVFDITEKQRAEIALHESEARYRQLFDANPHPMWVYDLASLRFLAVNAAAIAHYGFSREEFLAMTIKEIRPPEDIPAVLRKIAAIAQGGEGTGVWRHRKRDGAVIDVEVSSQVLEFDGQRAAVVLAHDVTERRRSEARSAGERSVLELLAAGAPLPVVLDRLARTYEELFPGMLCSVMLLDADGRRLRNGAAPSLPEAFSRAVDGIEIGPRVGSCGTAAYNRRTTIVTDIASDPLWEGGRELAAAHGLQACWSVPLISSHDQVLGTLALYYHQPIGPRAEEISAIERGAHFASLAIERHQLSQSLLESQVRLETLVSNLPGMAYRCLNDREWTMTFVSEGGEAITGYPREELENNRAVAFGDLVHPEDREMLWEQSQAAFAARTACQIEYRIIDRHGREHWVTDRATAGHAADGTVRFIDGFLQDVTAARQAKREREQLDRKVQETQKLESLGVLAGGIAHDFNNLLTSILGNASIATLELPPGSSVQDCIEQINEAALRAADLCKQMLAYSGRGRFVVQRLELGQLVEQTAQMLQISISKKAVLRFRLEKELPPVEVDATQIRQVIMNLVINASEAIGDRSGVISLTTGLTRVDRAYLAGTLVDADLPEGEYVFLEVSDTGCGMNAATRAKIFDPFFTTKFTGRGLGLAAVLGIVRGHKGALKVYSEMGRGTTFKLLFPAAAGAAEATVAPSAPPLEWHGQGTVLVVDDEETMRSTISRMMRKLGLDAVLTSDGRDALEIFRASPDLYRVVLLDLTMPHLDGEQTFAELRRLRPEVRVVLMSGFNAQEALVRFTGKGLADFLQKPFTIDALRSVLQSLLG